MVIHSKVLAPMHGFRDIEVLLQAEYDVMVIAPRNHPRQISCVSKLFDILFWLVIALSDPI